MPPSEADAGSEANSSQAHSETSSQRSDARALEKRQARAHTDDQEDLLEQKRSLQDGVFNSMYTLMKNAALASWKFSALKIILEGLMNFLVLFNPAESALKINTKAWIWTVIRWALWRSPVMRLYGYPVYIKVLYVMVAVVYVCVAALAWLTLAMRKQEQSKWLRRSSVLLNFVFDVIFSLCYVAFFDYFVFMANCDFGKTNKHNYFQQVDCLTMPHLVHMSVAGVTAIVFLMVTALLVVASCDLNPVSKRHLASPVAYARLKILFAKAVFIVVSDDLSSLHKLQSVLTLICISLVLWWNLKSMPFYRAIVDHMWIGMWAGIWYAQVILVTSVWSPADDARLKTLYILYGIFPMVFGGALLSVANKWWRSRPAHKFKALLASHQDLATLKLAKVHKFSSPEEVEVVSRAMRHFDRDGVILEDAAALGELIIKAGMATFPNQPMLLILYANFVMEVKKDGPASRTQLQIASKHSPTLVERYQIFCTIENSKALRDNQDGGMDLQAYVEFKRNYRAVLRVHKEALHTRNEFWRQFMRHEVKMADIDQAIETVQESADRAYQVYKRVLERYPNNGKLLKCYGKFLEDVRNDTQAAARAYVEAARNGSGDMLQAMNINISPDKPDFLTSMDINDDAVVIINAEGGIMLVNQGMINLFGYTKTEFEMGNISMCMPPPFSTHHNSFLQRYVATGVPHILDTVREVVALHKERYVFPVHLCVTKLSGVGADCVFLGIIRPIVANVLNVRLWVTTSGQILCADQHFSGVSGQPSDMLVGRDITTMTETPEEMQAVLNRVKALDPSELTNLGIKFKTRFLNHWLGPIPVRVDVTLGGTGDHRILVMHVERDDDLQGTFLVTDSRGAIKFATHDLAALLCYPFRELQKMKLDQLIPHPYSQMHHKWFKDQPSSVAPTSCRAGQVVHLLAQTGTQVPVKLKVDHKEMQEGGLVNVVQIFRAQPADYLNDKRIKLRVDFSGNVLSVGSPDSMLFGFPASTLVGSSLCDCVDVFDEWREINGTSELQLLMLALLDKEAEMPGTSWRVHVKAPQQSANVGSSVVALPAIKGAAGHLGGKGSKAMSRSACLQAEIVEDDDVNDNKHGGGGYGTNGRARRSSVEVLQEEREQDTGLAASVSIVLWRRDMLTGVFDLDADLRIRKASPLAGYIVGMPSSAILKQPLSKYLRLPGNPNSWEGMMGARDKNKKGALKSSAMHNTISAIRAFEGPHPDGGTMRLILQGVQEADSGKVQVIVHPDTTFVGAKANMFEALGLNNHTRDSADGAGGHHGHGHHRSHHRHSTDSHGAAAEGAAKQRSKDAVTAADDDAAGDADEAHGRDDGDGNGDTAGGVRSSVSRLPAGDNGSDDAEDLDELRNHSDDDDEEEDNDNDDGEGHASDGDLDADAAKLHKKAQSKSEFVAQWVRTISKQASGLPQQHGTTAHSMKQMRLTGAASIKDSARPSMDGPHDAHALRAIPEDEAALQGGADGVEGGGALLDGMLRSGAVSAMQSRRSSSKAFTGLASATSGMLTTKTSGVTDKDPDARAGVDSDGDGDGDGPADDDAKWEKGSEAASDDAASQSGVTSLSGLSSSAASENVPQIDTRRQRLQKQLTKLLTGPFLLAPVERLRLHTYAVLAVMLLTHVICYIVFTNLVELQHREVYMVHRQALAADRAQIMAIRMMQGTFCTRDNVTKVGLCAKATPQDIIGMVMKDLKDLEYYHQGTYLGYGSTPERVDKEVYDLWTTPTVNYTVYTDTTDTAPEKQFVETDGLWVLGNRLIAAVRESVYWLPIMRDHFRFHRAHKFVVRNGIAAVFNAYVASLDISVNSAWRELNSLQSALIILLVVEALAVQLVCTTYAWWLVSRVEYARAFGVLAMLGLPGPVLRQMSNKETRILEDSDEDEDDDADADDERAHDTGKATATAAAQSNKAGAEASERSQSADGALQAYDGEAQPHPQAKHSGSGFSVGSGDDNAPTGAIKGASHHEAMNNSMLADHEPGGGGGGSGRRRSGPGGALSGSGSGKRKQALVAKRSALHVNGKLLVQSYSATMKFMTPFLAWEIALIIIYAITFSKLRGMQGPLASLNMATHVIYRYTRVRAIALRAVTQDDMAVRATYQKTLLEEVRNLNSEYSALMYGGKAITQQGQVFQHEVPASAFESPEFSSLFFRTTDCMRRDQSTCAAKGSQYYQATNQGIDVMMRRIVAEMSLLAEDDPVDAVYNGTRYSAMINIGVTDLYEGLQTAAQLFVDFSIGRYNSMTQLHTILMVVTVLLLVGFVLFVMRPYLARVQAEAVRAAGMLSHVPHEMDVRGHVRTIVRRPMRLIKASKA